MERERLTVDTTILRSEAYQYLKPLVNKITNFAFVKIKNQLTKGLILEKEGKLNENECNCFVKKVWRLPCKHQLVEHKKKFGVITVDIVHRRWRIMTAPIEQKDDSKNKPAGKLYRLNSG